jgi:hypothetical protein
MAISPQSIRKNIIVTFSGVIVTKEQIIEASKSWDEKQEMDSYGYRIAIGMDLGSQIIPTSAKKYVEQNNFSK